MASTSLQRIFLLVCLPKMFIYLFIYLFVLLQNRTFISWSYQSQDFIICATEYCHMGTCNDVAIHSEDVNEKFYHLSFS